MAGEEGEIMSNQQEAKKLLAELRERQSYLTPFEINMLYQASLEDGGFFVLDCFPWEIKAKCPRDDCPMHQALFLPGVDTESGEPTGQELPLYCEPAGVLADFLLTVQRLQVLVNIEKRPK
jgi:hypothetical protein